MTLLDIGLFFGVSFVAAAVNSVAGGGTFLTFPVFMLNGLSPLQANIMSTIALWPGTLGSVYAYRDRLLEEPLNIKMFLVVGVFGGMCGALLLLNTSEQTFSYLVPWLLLGATLIFTFGRYCIALWHKLSTEKKERRGAGLVFQMAIALYGGYFGAGIGILTLAMLQVMGLSDIHRMNAIKTMLAAAVNAATVVIFIFSGVVIWPLACLMISGAVAGGYIGARLSVKIPPIYVRRFVSAVGFSMTAYFFVHGS